MKEKIKIDQIEKFFKDAFCGKSATVLPASEIEKFKIAGVVRIDYQKESIFVATLAHKES